MRCPQCQHDQKYRDGMRCGKCGYQFALNPKTEGLTDGKLVAVLRRLSRKGRHAFTHQQLRLALTEAVRGSFFSLASLLPFLVAGGLLVLGFTLGNLDAVGSFALFAVAVGAGIALHLVLKRNRRRSGGVNRADSSAYEKAGKLLRKYRAVHPIEGLASGDGYANADAARRDDLGVDLAFAPDAILVVERRDLVDALIRSRFHMEQKTAVVSADGYPEQVFARLPDFVAARPDLPVYIAHDLSRTGAGLVRRLEGDPRWVFAIPNLRDVGLSLDNIENRNQRLPWIDPRGRLVLTSNHAEQLRQGARLPLDFMSPAALTPLLVGALAGGALAIATAAAASDGLSIEFGDDFG